MGEQRMSYIIFFPRSGACRVFESYNLAQANYPNHAILTSSNDIPLGEAHLWYENLFEYLDAEGKHFVYGMEAVTSKITPRTFWKPRYAEAKLTPIQFQSAFWDLANECGDKVSRHNVSNEQGRKGKRPMGFRIDLVRANEVLAASPKLPKQAVAIVRFLTEQEFDYYTRDEMIRLCNSVPFLQAIKTRQDPYRIWRYYSPTLHKLGVLK
jgi:hypothetical protein